ncbi:hypothetical protein O181_023070 [Austropuccinia psidii MF-1]|uniref:Uncharacterized protein n=1 Tax=Austropuccinia psidii MF-1 TaxID=1389203 RepID=A0A9Q3GYQ6_9BASI|nr:hypothetical protein [Austropuccinia psidii MF-1]
MSFSIACTNMVNQPFSCVKNSCDKAATGVKFERCVIPRLPKLDKGNVTAFVFSAYPSCAEIHVSNGTDSSGNHVYNAWCQWEKSTGQQDRPLCHRCFKESYKTLNDPYCYQVP